MSARNLKHGQARTYAQTPEYNTWASMVKRCYDENNKAYRRYGGRGIAVDPRWLGERGFENFFTDMGPRPLSTATKKRWTIERKKNNEGYSKENCVWATHWVQASNRIDNKTLTMGGETLHLAAWERRYGLPAGTLSYRLRAGWGLYVALTTPIKRRA